MPHSMTGFAAVVVDQADHQISWELRSVNHRFLDLGFRLPDEYRRYEATYRQRVSEHVRRGKVDCTLRIARREEALPSSAVDERVLERLKGLQSAVAAHFPDAEPLSMAELLRWPGVVADAAPSAAELAEAVAAALDEAAESLAAARRTEGARIAALLEQRNAAILDLVAAIRPLAASVPRRQAEKLKERLGRLDMTAEPERLEQEIALLAQRLDVAEELDRIGSHVHAIRSALGLDEPVGRKLDFLIQELNREANTLASKVAEEEIARRAVELKVLIEQMREQVQNIE